MKIDTRTREERMKALREMTDEDIDYSDIPPLDEKFWKNAKVKPPLTKKKMISIRIKSSTISAIKKESKKEGIGYQTKIGAILDYYVMNRNRI